MPDTDQHAESVRCCGNYDCRCCAIWEAEIGRLRAALRQIAEGAHESSAEGIAQRALHNDGDDDAR